MHSPSPDGPTSERPIVLPSRVLVLPFAEVCRTTALEFLNGAGRTWQKRELAAWLAGPYRALTSFAQRQQRESERMINLLTRAAALRPQRRTTRSAEVPAARIREILTTSRREVGVTVESLRDSDLGVGFVFDILGGGHVQRCVDREGQTGWVPVDLPRMLLRDRVASLFAVDYLLRPEDYEHRLATCAECQLVSFDDATRGCERCRARNVSVTESGFPGDLAEEVLRAGAA